MTAATLGQVLVVDVVATGLVALAVVLVARVTRSEFLAVGAVAVAGVSAAGLLGVTEVTGVPPVVAAGVGIVLGGVVALAAVPFVRRDPVTGDAAAVSVVAMLVLAAAVDAGVARWTGATVVAPRSWLGDGVGGAVVVGLVLAVGLGWALRGGGRVATTLHMVGSSPAAARLAGVRVAPVTATVVAASGGLAVLGGLVIAPTTGLTAATATGLTVRGLAAVVVADTAVPGRRLAVAVAAVALVDVAVAWAVPSLAGSVGVAALVVAVAVRRGPVSARDWGRAW